MASFAIDMKLGPNYQTVLELVSEINEVVDYIPEYCLEAQGNLDRIGELVRELMERAECERKRDAGTGSI